MLSSDLDVPADFEERARTITGGPNLVRSLVQMDAPDHPNTAR